MELDYNNGQFVLVDWNNKSEHTIQEHEAFDWSSRVRVTRRANKRLDTIMERMGHEVPAF